MKKILIFSFLILTVLKLFATHNRAGEIVYKHLSGYKYEITVYTYTFTGSLADRDSLEVNWGDNTKSYIHRVQKNALPDAYQQNIYVTTHTYPGPGTYQIVMDDPNRNQDVKNIPNSVNVSFALKTILQINPLIGSNSTPILLNKPIDKAAKNQVFIHNPAAFDYDGDSISYKMAICLYNGGLIIPDFSLPPASNSIIVNPITGDLIWDSPTEIGIYNVAMEIEEWRMNVKISSIIRDIQIEVVETDNLPPEILPLSNMCVEADSLISFEVTANDPDGETVSLGAVGGVFSLTINPASFPSSDFPVSGEGTVSETFVWQTCCEHIQKQQYTVIFKAIDDNPQVKLTDYENIMIKVIGPATEIIDIEPTNASIFLRWKKSRCSNVVAYEIYRKNNLDEFYPNECQTGLPESEGYQLIKTIQNINDTTFLDNDNGIGLTQGFLYCYRIVCIFPDGAESYVSPKKCTELEEGLPILTKVSVLETDIEKGKIEIDWEKPLNLDTITIPGPYKYSMFYSNDLDGSFYQGPIEILGLNNTYFLDTLLNTKETPKIYKLGLLNYDLVNQNWNSVGPPSIASSIFLATYGSDKKITLRIKDNVPWEDEGFVIYRQNFETQLFDSIGWDTTGTFIDYNLENGVEYCYKVKGIGHYTLEHLPDPLINFSQISCVAPIDTIPPCPITFSVESNCDAGYNLVSWTLKKDSCSEGIKNIKIYFTDEQNGEMKLIQTIENAKDTFFIHFPEVSLAGCYKVTAIDTTGNESLQELTICVDNCTYYNLPNVFTPNFDSENDMYHPLLPYLFVEKINIKIYNRWGTLVFETEDPDINWDGKDMNSKLPVSDGVYYYLCDVYEHRLVGEVVRNISGFIHIYSEGSSVKP